MVNIKFFSATWCGPCQQMKPHMERLAKSGYPVEFIDIDEQPTIAESVEVRGVPTTAIYENGVLVERVVGYEDVDRLKKRIDIYHKPIKLTAQKKTKKQVSMKYKIVGRYSTVEGTLYKGEVLTEDGNSTLEDHRRLKDSMGRVWFIPFKYIVRI